MFSFFLDEYIPMYVSVIAFIFSICISTVLIFNIIKKAQGDKGVLPLVGIHALSPAIASIVGRFIDIIIYANSIGGIEGATPYTFVLILSYPIMYVVSFFILWFIAYFYRKHILNSKH